MNTLRGILHAEPSGTAEPNSQGKGERMQEFTSQAVARCVVIEFVFALSMTLGAPAGAQQAKQSPYEIDASANVGSETCKTCHEDLPSKGFYKAFEDSPHFVTTLDTKDGPERHGCEACHGPGREHVHGGGDKTKIFTFKNASAKEISERCLACHPYDEEQSNFSRSAHMQNNVSCIDCHSPHHAKESQFLMKEKQPQLCYDCHQETKQQFNRPFHHRVNEGLV
jgi:predicted CXXCH cytochrome family protein